MLATKPVLPLSTREPRDILTRRNGQPSVGVWHFCHNEWPKSLPHRVLRLVRSGVEDVNAVLLGGLEQERSVLRPLNADSVDAYNDPGVILLHNLERLPRRNCGFVDAK